MSEFAAAEFTGERVIPELVDSDLLNEHLARYRFATRFAAGLNRPLHILDAGCGSGYGTAGFAGAASVIGSDISSEAVDHARAHYGCAGVRFIQGACEALPFPAALFDLVTAFEVIEHLDHWQEFLTEAHRVLKPSGSLLVSTPNRDYYAESRGSAGPNPFHRHEFDYEEFRCSLNAVFPQVRIWTQNHAEAIVFAPQDPVIAAVEASGSNDPAKAHFYLAACSQSPIAANDLFAWLPSSANVLRERELHIAKLNDELEKKDVWLRQTIEAHSQLHTRHEALTAELQRQNNWAAGLNREIAFRNARIAELQGEQEIRLSWIGDLESQIDRSKTEIERLRAESSDLRHEAQAEISRLESMVTERTLWAERLNGEIAEYREELRRIGSSKWVRAGAKLGIGPAPNGGQ